MPSKTSYWKLGLFVVVSVVLGLGVITWVAVTRLSRESITAYMYFDEPVDGLEVGSAVKFRGVKIGKVADINTAPDARHVEVQADIFTEALVQLGLRDPDEPLRTVGEELFVPADLRVQLESSALTGITYVQMDFFDPAEYPIPDYPFEVPWNTIYSAPSTFKSLESGLIATLEHLPPLAKAATDLLARLDGALRELDPGELSQRLQILLESAQEQIEVIEQTSLIERAAEALQSADRTLDEVRAAVAELRAEGGPIDRLVDRLDSLAAKFAQEVDAADQALDAIAAASKRVGVAAETVASLGREARITLKTMQATLEAVRQLAEVLERDPGALLHGRTPPPPLDRRDR